MGKTWERRLRCFVVMPFGHKADERGVVHDMDNVYRELIVPAVERVGERRPGVHIDVTRADQIPGAGSIHREMFEQLLDADIAVVDLTLANPNVFYELGVRHALRDRVTVLIREANTAIPFNINGQKITEYTVGFGTPTELIDSVATDIATGLDGRADSQVLDLLDLDSRARPHRLAAGPVYRAEIAGHPDRSLEVVVCHLAAVQAEPGGGFRPASEVQRGISAVVEAVESRLADGSWAPVDGTARVLLPLMGTGTARERPATVVSALLTEAHRLLSADDRHQAIRSLQFLARTDVHLDLCLTEGDRAGMGFDLVPS